MKELQYERQRTVYLITYSLIDSSVCTQASSKEFVDPRFRAYERHSIFRNIRCTYATPYVTKYQCLFYKSIRERTAFDQSRFRGGLTPVQK